MVDVACRDDGRVQAWMEDDFHHFGVRISFAAGRITDVAARVVRAPWITCPQAVRGLRSLVGHALFSRNSQIGRVIPMRANCTHLFDLAGLAIAAAARAIPRRRYEAIVSERAPRPPPGKPHVGCCTAILLRDDAEMLRWVIQNEAIVDAGTTRSLLRGFRSWTEGLSEDDAEAAGILRRAIDVSGGRTEALEKTARASDLGLPPLCYSYQPEVALQATRAPGSIRDFSASHAGMLNDIEADF